MALRVDKLDTTFPKCMTEENMIYSPQDVSEAVIVKLILKQIHPSRRVIAKNQVYQLLKKIKIHPERRMVYITLIKDLVEFEKKQYGVKIE